MVKAIWREVKKGFGTLHVYTINGSIYSVMSKTPDELIGETEIEMVLGSWQWKNIEDVKKVKLKN